MKECKINLNFIKWVAISILAVIFTVTLFCVNLSNKANAETEKNLPIITIDSKDFETPPNAVLGKEYKIFSASAVDAFGEELSVLTSLYMYYYSPNPSSVSIKYGTFTPTLLGEYTVEYSATDMAGNTTIKTYNFSCVEKSPLIGVLSFEQGETLVGERAELPTISYENNTGKVDCYVSGVIISTGKVIKEIDVDNFIPEYVGEYKITYKYQDYVESGEVEYLLTVKENPCTKLCDEINIPKYFILGCSYKLPNLNFVTYVSGKPCKVIPKITVKYGGELDKSIDADNFIPEKEGDLTIIYSAIVSGNKTDKKYFAKVVDVNFGEKLDLNKYFYSEYAVTTLARNDVTITTATPNSPIDFINSILAERTSVTFKIKNTENFFNSFDIYLTDSVDSNIKVKFSLLKNNAESGYFSINNEKGIKTTANFYDGKSINFEYSNSTLSALFGEMTAVKIKKDLNGNLFEGFPSGKVYLSFSFGGLNKQSSVTVLNVNGQAISKAGDKIAPQTIYTRNDVVKNVGDEITISPVLVSDVLNPNYSVEYYVLDPEDNYAMDLNGVVLSPENTDYSKEYSLLLTKYGSYNVVINVKDGFGNSELYSYGINVEDMESPLIYISGSIDGEKKVGQTITLPKAMVNDNLSKKCALIVYYMDGTGEVHKLSGSTLKLSYSGRYTIFYYATDDAGNVSYREITFNVVR